jgi:hypothetical protein
MKNITVVDPLPIYRDEEQHKYIWEPTGEVLAYSTTQVSGGNKTPEAIAAIERTRSVWQPRGETVHWCLQQKMLGDPEPDPGDYKEWVEPLLNLDYWKDFRPWAVEYMLCDLEKSVGGQLDLLGYDVASNQVVLIDLKTQGSIRASRYNTDAQLGSYVLALKQQKGLVVDQCRTVWARPGKSTMGPIQEPKACVLAWTNAWDKFTNDQEIL